MKVLIIDDSATARLMSKKIMEMIGVEGTLEFVEATNGAEAIQVLEKDNKVDFILCDVNMPVMSGFTFIRNVKMRNEWNHIPLVFVTSLANDARSQNLLTMGAKAVISKPIKMNILKKICEHLGLVAKKESQEGWG